LTGSPDKLRSILSHQAAQIPYEEPRGTLQDGLKGADVFIGLSVGNVLRPDDLDLMAPDRIVFAMANPDPEIAPELGAPRCRVFATGRSDYPNQINNVLAFPGIFRGALDVQARDINDDMYLAAARAIAEIIPEEALSEDYIIPSVFDRQVVTRVSKAVADAARVTGVARRLLKN
jgi:malate dehydrogenase (oxaloacetate-decarboxylating)